MARTERAASGAQSERPSRRQSAPGEPPGTAPVVFNALSLQPQGCGVQLYVRSLLHAMAEELHVDVVAAVFDDAVGELPPRVRPLVRRGQGTFARVVAGRRGVDGAALVHGLDVQVPSAGAAGVPTVSTVHDLGVFDVPGSFSRRYGAAQRRIMGHAAWRADAIVADSAFTADRLRLRFGRDAHVVPLAAPADMAPPGPEAAERIRSELGLPDRFVLYVGRTEPRKDVVTLGRACGAAGLPLVIAGKVPAAAAAPPGAIHVGYVPRNRLAALYGTAAVVAYPSTYEGFGLPPLEAMACGAPVVAYDIPPLRATVAGAAELVAPGDGDALASALRRVVHDDDLRADLARRGLATAAGRSWGDVARDTAAVYRTLGVAC